MSDHTPCHIFRKANDGKCYNCGFTLSEHQRLERIRDAAPDMYEALKAVRDELDAAWRNRTLPAVAISAETVQRYEAALAKAEEA